MKPDWDIAAIQKRNDPALLRALIPRDGPEAESLALVGEWAIADGQELSEFDPEEIRVLCSSQWGRQRSARATGRVFCPAKNLSQQDLRATAQLVLSSPNKVLANYLKKRSQEVFSRDNGFEVYVYSHTHKAARGCSPMPARKPGDWRPIVANTGAWQRTASPEYIEKPLADARAGTGGEGAADPFQGFNPTPETLAQNATA